MSVNFLICGFMGSGKSTFLKRLMQKPMDFTGHDLDVEIATKLGIEASSLGQWIEQHSLAEFRQEEFQALEYILGKKGNKLVALGGGTLEAPGVMELIALDSGTKLVFLDVPLETCLARTSGDLNRPLLALGKESLKNLYAQRLTQYRRAQIVLTESKIKEIDGVGCLVHNL